MTSSRIAVGLILLATIAGCGQPQVGGSNLRLIAGLRTAISARRVDWLDASQKVSKERHDAGQLADEPFAAIQAIIAQAREGDWKGAEENAIELARGQRAGIEEPEAPNAPTP